MTNAFNPDVVGFDIHVLIFTVGETVFWLLQPCKGWGNSVLAVFGEFVVSN